MDDGKIEAFDGMSLIKWTADVSSQVKWAKFRQKVYQFWGEVSPGSIPAEKVS